MFFYHKFTKAGSRNFQWKIIQCCGKHYFHHKFCRHILHVHVRTAGSTKDIHEIPFLKKLTGCNPYQVCLTSNIGNGFKVCWVGLGTLLSILLFWNYCVRVSDKPECLKPKSKFVDTPNKYRHIQFRIIAENLCPLLRQGRKNTTFFASSSTLFILKVASYQEHPVKLLQEGHETRICNFFQLQPPDHLHRIILVSRWQVQDLVYHFQKGILRPTFLGTKSCGQCFGSESGQPELFDFIYSFRIRVQIWTFRRNNLYTFGGFLPKNGQICCRLHIYFLRKAYETVKLRGSLVWMRSSRLLNIKNIHNYTYFFFALIYGKIRSYLKGWNKLIQILVCQNIPD